LTAAAGVLSGIDTCRIIIVSSWYWLGGEKEIPLSSFP
jgi:hypothetical protein